MRRGKFPAARYFKGAIILRKVLQTQKGAHCCTPFGFRLSTDDDYFVFGDSFVTGGIGFKSLLTLVPSTFFTSGDVTGLMGEAFGSTDGLTTGEATGLAVTTGTGVATGLFGNVLVFGSQAPNTAVLTAKTDANINDLLIVFSS